MKHTVEARADRWLRRHTGPWRTDAHSFGPVGFEHRYRYRPRIEFVRLWVAEHDLQRELFRAMAPLLRWLARHLPGSPGAAG